MIIERTYSENLKIQMENYYEEVLVRRAIADPRDGLMDVQRKILWTMQKNGRFSNKKYTKCARLVGDTFAYYIHGDASLYGSMINLSQDWNNHLPLIDTHGNNGSMFGDAYAAMRYVEAKLDKNAEDLLLADIKSNCIDFVPNYDFSEKEPSVLPAKVPMYLINGNFGIAAGYMVSAPTHNPYEVIEETIKLIKDSNYQVNLYPDFPTGANIIENKNLKKAYSEGQGNCIIRATIEKDEKNNILKVKDIPYMKTLDSILEQIKEFTKDKKDGKKIISAKLSEIKDIKDNSTKGKIDVDIIVKKDYSLDTVLSKLYKFTSLQVTMPLIFVGSVDGKFKCYNNINEVIEEWINFRRITVKRIKLNNIRKWKLRDNIIEGLLKILDSKTIDKVIADIKKASSKKDVIDLLQNKYGLNEIQAEEVAELKLYKLSGFSINDLKQEKKELNDLINKETEYFKNSSLIDDVIIEELEDIKKRVSKIKRKTKILPESELDNDKQSLIPDIDYTIIVTKKGYIKKLQPINSQKRNGKGNSVGKLKENDYPVFVEELNNKDSLFILTNIGKAYKIMVSDLNEGTSSTLGTSISSQINNEEITTCLAIPNKLDITKYGIMLCTKLNKIKITPLEEYSNLGKSGIISSKLNENDSIIKAILIKIDKERIPREVLITSTGGFSSVIDSDDIPLIKRTTYGCAAMNNSFINENNLIASIDARKDIHTHIFVLSKNGFGKLIDINEFTKTKRGTKGVMNAKLKDDDNIITALYCNQDQEITIVSNKNIIKIPASEIPVTKRPTYGCKIKNLVEDEYIIDVTIM